ncbi:hypothetical protein T09_10115 [Trichinella sp. T9]|nr:hypothetical protein T09_10115 [Trichinella sp. T9]
MLLKLPQHPGQEFESVRTKIGHSDCAQFIELKIGPQAFAPGYAPGQIKICIFPQAMPRALYCTIFALREVLCKFLIAWGNMQIFICPQATPQAMP